MNALPIGGQLRSSGEHVSDLPSNSNINHGQKISYAATVAVLTLKTKLKFRPPELHKGKQAVFFSPQEEEELAKACRFTIVGKFSHGKPSLDDIRRDFAARYQGHVEKVCLAPNKKDNKKLVGDNVLANKATTSANPKAVANTDVISAKQNVIPNNRGNHKVKIEQAKEVVEKFLQKNNVVVVEASADEEVEEETCEHQDNEESRQVVSKSDASAKQRIPASSNKKNSEILKPRSSKTTEVVIPEPDVATDMMINSKDDKVGDSSDYDSDYGEEQESKSEDVPEVEYEECEVIEDAVSQQRKELVDTRNLSPRNICKSLHKTQIIAIQEPFVKANQIDKYRRGLGFEGCYANCNGKIWVLWSAEFDAAVAENNEQQITFKITRKNDGEVVWFTAVYAKSKQYLRVPLWDNLIHCNNYIDDPWCIYGDFNAIMGPKEKKGGNPHRMEKSWEFISCMEDCGMVDASYKGLRFTWCNARGRHQRIWKRLDRVFINHHWTDKFSFIDIEHLASTGSDHTPMLVKCSTSEQPVIKYFKFLNFWIDRPNFKTIVQEAWNIDVEGNYMRRLQLKLKQVSSKLSQWSREKIGSVFDQVKEWEHKMQDLETEYIDNDVEDLRPQVHKAQAEHTKWLKCEESILKQRANIKWIEEGDSNTKYFHAIINERRRRTSIHRIQRSDGQWINGEEDIAREAVKYFSAMFKDEGELDLQHLDCIDQKEIRKAVFDLNSNSSPGPDGFGGSFYQSCWDIIKLELIEFIQQFFGGAELSRFFTISCLILLPKVENPSSFNNMRPISLSNCSNKIISKIMSSRLNSILPKIIFNNQTGFLKGISITENVLLAQEIIHGIGKKNFRGNTVIKLDMAKAYDRVN
uniref:Uncharacterized protein LOC104234350 n=1 Tax=Nicotiana sylvestris TaxID=4096 RepID=A0A1U7XGY7_NICSY|nr:PREDICTED: uncharacterized protein LOC104234350 [Nicotiana sylvestris]